VKNQEVRLDIRGDETMVLKQRAVVEELGISRQPKRRHSTATAGAIDQSHHRLLTGTKHVFNLGDARNLAWIADTSVHLVVTSPPYWTLKKYNDHPAQLGSVQDYELFMDELDKVWQHSYRVLVEGGRLVVVVGDVCIARRRNNGRHLVMPLHADISVRARRLGFDYLTPILWHKIANASYEVENGSSFLGKPFEPNAIIKNDTEYVLMLRKPGSYRKPTEEQRRLSKIGKEDHARWFRSMWTDVPGASTRDHPAPFPVELAHRIVRMFSFSGDTVLDPFSGTGSTALAAVRTDRSSISNEIDPEYLALAMRRLQAELAQGSLFPKGPTPTLVINGPT
jgi:site-specific DNA-methyltransferase (adenine-specific)